MKKRVPPVVADDELSRGLEPQPLPIVLPRIARAFAPMKPNNLFANVRPDGLMYKQESSLMGSTRKLPNGEIV